MCICITSKATTFQIRNLQDSAQSARRFIKKRDRNTKNRSRRSKMEAAVQTKLRYSMNIFFRRIEYINIACYGRFNIHENTLQKNRQRRATKVLRREDEVEGQKDISKIQMWKRDQSKGILERRGRKEMRTM